MKSARYKMKKFLPHSSKIALLFSLVVLMGGFFFPETAHAGFFDSVGDKIADAILLMPGALSLVLLQVLSLVLYLAGTILNYVTDYTIVDMADNIRKAGINEVWGTIRDVANMGFIFVLLYAAIRLILGIGGGTQRLIVNIVLVAILINFSLFFTKLVIDASNILAVTFYGAMAPGALSGDDIINTGLANSIMEPLKVQTLAKEVSGFDGTKMITVGILGSVFVLIAAFVLFAISIMLLIRFVVLIFVLILSPIAFVAMILPGAGGQSKQWWNALSGQAFFAPIFFMFVWVVISISQNLYTADGSLAGALQGSVTETNSGAGANALSATPSTGDIGLVVNFFVVIALLIAALTIAKSWANKAGPAVSGATKWAMGAAGTSVYGGSGWLGRRTLGRAGQALYENENIRDKAPTSRMARLALAAGRKTGSSSFDFRATKAGEGTVGKLGAGKASGKGGFTAAIKKEVENEKKYADEIFKVSDLTTIHAEKELDEAKKSGDATKIAAAQDKVDKLKGLSEDESRKRKIREIRIADGLSEKEAKKKLSELENQRFQKVAELVKGGMDEKSAEKEAEKLEVGWKPKSEKSVTNIRKEKYAEGIENPEINIPKKGKVPFSFTRRHLGFGPITKESALAASAIRKSMKDKKASEKIADEIAKQAKEAADDSDSGTSPTGNTPPSSGEPSGTEGKPTDDTTSTT